MRMIERKTSAIRFTEDGIAGEGHALPGRNNTSSTEQKRYGRMNAAEGGKSPPGNKQMSSALSEWVDESRTGLAQVRLMARDSDPI